MKKIIFFIAVILTVARVSAQTQIYPKEFFVAQDGSAQFKTIQEAVNAVRDLSQQVVTIHIKKGIYAEKLIIPSWKTKIALVGEDKENTIITNADFSGKPFPGGKDAMGRAAYSTYTSYTVLVQGNDFTAENLTIENKAGRVGQAVALHVEGDRCVVKNCKLLGNQDTLYAATEGSRQFYQNCYIEGTTDFIFGEATAVFQDCTLRELTNSVITAASTTPRQRFGYVFFHCTIVADDGLRVELGRPWRPYAKVVFISCNMGNHVVPLAWSNWGNRENEKTVLYAEYDSKNAGNIAGRPKWTKQLTANNLKEYTLPNILGGADHWNPLK